MVELPSPYAGTVSALLVTEGQTVDVGIPIITIDVPVAGETPADTAPAETAATTEAAAEPEPQPQPPTEAAAPAPPARQPVLVGYGVKPGSTSRRPRKLPPTRPGSYPASPSCSAQRRSPPRESAGQVPPPIGGSRGRVGPRERARAYLAKPPVRRLARDLGVDLGGLTGSGPEGSVTREDVQKAAGEATVRSTPRSFAGADRRAAARRRAQPGGIRGPLRSGSRCAGCASTPPPRWWRARSPRPM